MLAVFAALGTQLALGHRTGDHRRRATTTAPRPVRACPAWSKIQDARQVKSASMRHQAREVDRVVPELPRCRRAPAHDLAVFVRSADPRTPAVLEQVVTTFAGHRAPSVVLSRPAEQLDAGRAGRPRFVAFSLDSIRLVNRGDPGSTRPTSPPSP